MKTDLNVPSKSNKQKHIICWHLVSHWLKKQDLDSESGSGSESESGSVSQWHRSEDPDPDPYQNVTHPQHRWWLNDILVMKWWKLKWFTTLSILVRNVYLLFFHPILHSFIFKLTAVFTQGSKSGTWQLSGLLYLSRPPMGCRASFARQFCKGLLLTLP